MLYTALYQLFTDIILGFLFDVLKSYQTFKSQGSRNPKLLHRPVPRSICCVELSCSICYARNRLPTTYPRVWKSYYILRYISYLQILFSAFYSTFWTPKGSSKVNIHVNFKISPSKTFLKSCRSSYCQSGCDYLATTNSRALPFFLNFKSLYPHNPTFHLPKQEDMETLMKRRSVRFFIQRFEFLPDVQKSVSRSA